MLGKYGEVRQGRPVLWVEDYAEESSHAGTYNAARRHDPREVVPRTGRSASEVPHGRLAMHWHAGPSRYSGKSATPVRAISGVSG